MTIEWVELILKHALSWPVAAVVIAFYFKNFLPEFLDDVEKFKWGSIELNRKIQEVDKRTQYLTDITKILVNEGRVLEALTSGGSTKTTSSSVDDQETGSAGDSDSKANKSWLIEPGPFGSGTIPVITFPKEISKVLAENYEKAEHIIAKIDESFEEERLGK